MSQAKSVQPSRDPQVQYLLRLGDACLILGQRLGEWCGHAPVLEEDIALSNIALDLIGQARGVLTRAGQVSAEKGGPMLDEDQLAFLRDEREYLNPTLVELPGGPTGGDFATTVLRNTMMAAWLRLMWTRLQGSSDAEIAAIAGKAVKEARYHLEHASDWIARLGNGTDESRRRMNTALETLWRYSHELFDSDVIDEAAASTGLGPRWSDLRTEWQADMDVVLADARLSAPPATAFLSTGKRGIHSEHMGYLLCEMQFLQRNYPRGAW